MVRGASHVLVVDDEKFFREAIGDVLDGAGLPFLTADRGSEALALAEDERLGAVILDIQMPEMGGLEVFARLKEIRPDLPVIILSAQTDQGTVLEALRLGACDYLAKPLHEEELVLAVGRALDRHRLGASWSHLRERLRRLEDALNHVWAEAGERSFAESAAQLAADVLESTKSSLMLLDEGGETLRVAAACGRDDVDAKLMDAVALGSGVAGLAFAAGEPLVVEDVQRDPRFAGRDEAGRYESGAFAVAPLSAGDRKLGVLCVTDRSKGAPFDEEDLALLRILAAQIGRKLLAEEVAEPAAAGPGEAASSAVAPAPEEADAAPGPTGGGAEDGDADLARAICDAVTAEVEPLRILSAALRPVADTLGAAPVSLYLLREGRLLRETEWDGGERADREELPLGRGLTGFVLETGQMVASEDPASDPRFDADVDTPEDGTPGSLLCGPVRFRGKTLGLFRAFPAERGVPSARTGEILGAALSAAVRNVLLYRSLVESIEEVARARRESRDA